MKSTGKNQQSHFLVFSYSVILTKSVDYNDHSKFRPTGNNQENSQILEKKLEVKFENWKCDFAGFFPVLF